MPVAVCSHYGGTKVGKLEDHIGEKYNHLTITGIDRGRMAKDKFSSSYVFADCDCGICGGSYNLAKVRRGETKSCGHLKYGKKGQRKFNKIVHKDGCGVIYAGDMEFLFDLEDEHYLVGKWWYKDDYGYLTHVDIENGKNIYTRFHRLVMCAKDGEFVDHVSREKNDNRKRNLRICTHRENDINKGISERNTSGVIGVCLTSNKRKWTATVSVRKKQIFLGNYDNFEDAVKARLKGEQEYYGEYAPQKHLFEKYLRNEVDGGEEEQ